MAHTKADEELGDETQTQGKGTSACPVAARTASGGQADARSIRNLRGSDLRAGGGGTGDRGRNAGAVYGERPRFPAMAEADAGERFRVAREPDREKPSDEWARS